MAEMITLQLSDDTLRRARDAAQRTGDSLESVLTTWIERSAAADEIAPLIPGATYRIYTPFGNDAIAQRMLELLEAEKAKDNPADTAG